ncbi:MAG: DUF2141 domain-containing protein [Limisphaerales bacterium]|jgi:uncharacterized protein (DUF2141 family)
MRRRLLSLCLCTAGPIALLLVNAFSAEPADAPPAAAALTVTVTGIRSDKGKMHYALFNDPKGFTDHAIDGTAVMIEAGKAQWKIKKLAPGEYAIACFHDENDDGKFNQNFIGIPLEDYGFSNEARAGLGPPAWSKVVFKVSPGENQILIRFKKR